MDTLRRRPGRVPARAVPSLVRRATSLVISAVALLLCLGAGAEAAMPLPVASLALPRAARSMSAGYDEAAGLLLVATAPRRPFPELYAVHMGDDLATPAIVWSLDLGTKVHSIAITGHLAYLATARNDAELLIVDLALQQVVGSFDAPGPADAKRVELVAEDVVLLGRRRNGEAEFYRLDVSSPSAPVVLEAIEDPRGVRPSRPERLPRYFHRGRLVARAARPFDRGFLHYLVTTDPVAQVQVAEQQVPVTFPDANGDGIYRLGCVGDSNTTRHLLLRWCELLWSRIDDPDFEVVNVARAGATVTENLRFDSDATMQMAEVLEHEPDAVVLAFGTNDALQGRTSAAVIAAYLAQEATALAAGVAFHVATTPPINACTAATCPRIFETNAFLRERFPGRVVEFFDGFAPEHFRPDGFHVNDAGHALRAERAFHVLANPAVYDVP